MALDDSDFKMLDGLYRRKDDCDDKMSEADRRMNNFERDMAVVNTKLTWLIGILCAIAVPILGIAIKYLFGGN